jgi:hypothetical protein
VAGNPIRRHHRQQGERPRHRLRPNVTVETDQLRLWITASHQDVARIKEIVVWPAEVGDLPPLPKSGRGNPPGADIPEIYLNQSGFNLGKPKRFTAPTLADGTPSSSAPPRAVTALAKGIMKNHIGDFSSFNPEGDAEYVVEAGGITSVPFRIGPFWLERVTYQNAVDFMIDSRHHVGNDRNVCRGSFGWRDDHHFGWELHTLVPQYLSNPSAYERMPRQVKYEKPKDKKLWGALEPYNDDAPDIVKLIHWGADVIVTQKLGHEHLKAQLAYFLYAWPALKAYLPAQNYQIVRDYAFKTWTKPKRPRLPLRRKHGTQPARPQNQDRQHQGRAAARILRRAEPHDARGRQTRKPPRCRTLFRRRLQAGRMDDQEPRLERPARHQRPAHERVPHRHRPRPLPPRIPRPRAAGLKKINEWAEVIVRRSDNLWDFRKLDDKDGWTPMGDSPQKWNEPGNVIGLPAPSSPPANSSPMPTPKRLDQLVWSHFDNMFGRNPVGRHFSFDAPREVEGVEHGWFRVLPRRHRPLADARFVIDGSPKNAHYPYHPELGDIGWTEGWIQFNVCYNISLSYLAWSESKVELARQGDELVIRLTAPLNFDYNQVETGSVTVASGQGDEERVTVTEDSPTHPPSPAASNSNRPTPPPRRQSLQFKARHHHQGLPRLRLPRPPRHPQTLNSRSVARPSVNPPFALKQPLGHALAP